jgi:hypothetical protein
VYEDRESWTIQHRVFRGSVEYTQPRQSLQCEQDFQQILSSGCKELETT